MKLSAFVLFILALSTICLGQLSETEQAWNQPVEPFKIAGNIYYVGASDLTSYLITTPKGHILLDSGMLQTVPQIKANVAKLGFKFEDIKFLVNSHAHYDHAGGLAELKRLTGAKLYASDADAKLLARGGKDDPNFDDKYPFEAVTADTTFSDGFRLKHGGTLMTALVTPGHTKGCTTWTTEVNDGGQKLKAVFVCSTSAPGYKLVGNERYPEIVSDYEATYKRLKALDIDIFLASHASAFHLDEKLKIRQKGTPSNAFIDRSGFLNYLNSTEASFRKLLESQRAK
jgi:metallo-beta-lactamase class B